MLWPSMRASTSRRGNETLLMLRYRCTFIKRLCLALLKYRSITVRSLYFAFHSSEQRGSSPTILSQPALGLLVVLGVAIPR